MTRNEQFAYIEAARQHVLGWARSNGIALHRIEYVVPFVDTDFRLSVWFFYETDAQLQKARALRWSQRLMKTMKSCLRSLGYAEECISAVSFTFDSHENVERDYQGSYFYRLR